MVQSGLDCTNVFGPMLRGTVLSEHLWAGVMPKVISLGVNFSVPKEQNSIPKAGPPREERLDLLQIREEERGIKRLGKWP